MASYPPSIHVHVEAIEQGASGAPWMNDEA